MITIVAPAFKEVKEAYSFIGSLLVQTDPRWEAIIYCNGHNSDLKAIVDLINDERITYLNSEVNTGYWGCYNRIEALNNKVDTEYILQSSIQDYFVPVAIEKILNSPPADFIYWNSVNHLFTYAQVLNSSPEIGRIDWGNFAVKTGIGKQVGIKMPKEFCADGIFVKDLMNSGLIKTKIKLQEILTIHN